MKVLKITLAVLICVCANQNLEAQNDSRSRVKLKAPTSVLESNNNKVSKDVANVVIEKSVKKDPIDEKVIALKNEFLNASESRRLEIDVEILKLAKLKKEQVTVKAINNKKTVSKSLKDLNSSIEQNLKKLSNAKYKLKKAKLALAEQRKENELSETEIVAKQANINSVEAKIKNLETSIQKAKQLLDSKL